MGRALKAMRKRYGADFGDLFIGRMIGAAVLPSILHQDPRYFYQGTGSIRSRAWHALSAAFVCRGDNGRSQFNYSHILGNLAAGGISNLYRPDANRGVGLVFDNALLTHRRQRQRQSRARVRPAQGHHEGPLLCQRQAGACHDVALAIERSADCCVSCLPWRIRFERNSGDCGCVESASR